VHGIFADTYIQVANDGVLSGTTAISRNVTTPFTHFAIGELYYGAASTWKATELTVAAVAIFPRALNASEVAAQALGASFLEANPSALFELEPGCAASQSRVGTSFYISRAPSVSTSRSLFWLNVTRPINDDIFIGAAAGVTNYTLNADSASYTLTGGAATLRVARKLSADAGSYTLTGSDAGLKAGRRLSADAGAYTLTVSDAALKAARQLSGASGTYTITVADATLTYGQATTYSLVADAGTYTVTGSAATFLWNHVLSAGSGAVQINVGDANLVYSGAVVPTREQPAGGGKARRKPSKVRRKPVLVTIDGQDFVVRSEAEAEQLVEEAVKASVEVAEHQAEAIVAKREKKAKRADLNLAPLTLDLPKIEVKPLNDGPIDDSWVADVNDRMSRIAEAYEEVARKYQSSLQLRHQAELDDEDALVSLLLTL